MGMKPHCAITLKITNLVGAGDSGVAVDFHHGSNGVNVLEQVAVHASTMDWLLSRIQEVGMPPSDFLLSTLW